MNEKIDLTDKVVLEKKELLSIVMTSIVIFLKESPDLKMYDSELCGLVWDCKENVLASVLIALEKIENDQETNKGEVH